MVRRQVEQVLVRNIPSDKLIGAVEISAYDETPMVVRVQDNCIEPKGEGAEAQDSVQLTELLKTVAPGHSKEKMVAKVLQLKQSHAFLVQVGAQHIMIVGDALLPLQAMQHNNSNVMLEILQRFSCFSPACKRFQCHSRCVVADKAKCNPKAETHLQDSRRLSSTSSLLQCDLHNIAACTRKTLDGLLGHHCSGLIRLALSLQVGSAMSTFKRALREEIAESLVLKIGSLDPKASEFKRYALDLCWNTSTRRLRRKLNILSVCNGDWRNAKQIEYYTDRPGCLQDKSEITKLLVSALENIFLKPGPTIFRRDRWIGGDIAAD
eukprot:6492316-Amphidinium_carterae.1